eukprot:191972_1
MGTKGFNDLAVVSVISSSIVVIFQIIFISSLINSFYHDEHINSKMKRIAYVALSTFTCLGIAFICWIIDECLYRLHPNPNSWVPFYWLFFVFLLISFLFFYAFMLLRLYYIFDGTIFQINPITKWLHIIMNIQITIGGIIAIIFNAIGYNSIYYILAIILLIIFCVSLFHLVYLFNVKLFKLTILTRQTIVSNKSNEELNLNERQLSLLATMRKHTLLGSTMVAIVVFDVLIVVIYNITSNYMIWTIGWSLTMTIGSLCIYLGFIANKSAYIFVCGQCDVCCRILCIKITERKIRNMVTIKDDHKQQELIDEPNENTPLKHQESESNKVSADQELNDTL